jgi:hypothetical protein
MKKLKRREVNLEYSVTYKGYQIEDIIEASSIRGCPWFRGLKPILGGTSIIEAMKAIHNKLFSKETSHHSYIGVTEELKYTAKVCPAIREELKRAILIKTPCDLVFTYDSKGNLVLDTPSNVSGVSISTHPSYQVTSSSNPLPHFSNKIFIKYELPVVVLFNPSLPYLFLEPQFHEHPPGQVVRGTAPANSEIEGLRALNIIVAMELPPEGETTTVFIKKGKVLAYLWADADVSLVDSNRGFWVRTKFIGNV